MPKQNHISRRKFLELGGAALGSSVLVCSGLTFVITREPEIELIQNSFGGNSQLGNKILLAYASKSGTTVDVAQTIGKSLSEKGAAVDVRPIKSIKSVDGYHAIIIGSGVRMGKWLPEAVEFVQEYQAQLREVPTAFFTVHLLHLDDSEESRGLRASYTAPVREMVTPKTETFFAGRMEYAKLSLFEGMISKMMKAQERDLRDWGKIRAWAETLQPILS